MMARREQSQFDDALEDVESDLLNPKTHSSSGPTPYIQRNGHLSSRREMEEPQHDGTNGELPESDTAEEEVQEERTEDEWIGRHEDADEARIEHKKPLSPEEDGQDEYGDTFFIDQGDTSIQGMGYGSSYQYSEGDDGTREGTEDSGQGQIRDDLTESDKDKDYLDDVTQDNRGVVYDRDDQYEDSGVVDDNGMTDGESGMQGYEAEEDNAEGEDRFEEVDIRYGYMDGGYVTERQTYSESHQYVEDNPAYNGSEQDYEVDQEFREKGASFQEYTESDLPDHISASGDKSIEESREDEKYEHEGNSKEHIDQFSDSEKLRLGEHSPMTSDYVIVDRDTLAPEENLRYAASDSAEADQEEQQPIQQEDYDHGNTGLDDKKSEFMTLDMLQDRLRNQRGESKLHPLRFDDRVETRDSGMTVPSSQDRLKTDHEKSIKGQGQLRKSPQPASSPVRDTKESRNKVPRRPAPGAAQSVQRIPAAVPSSNVVHQSPRDIAPVPHHKAPSPGRHGVENERGTIGKGETTSQRSSRPTVKASREGGGMQESRVKTDSSKRITGGEKQRSMPLPGGAQPVSVLKSRLREELREMYEIEKNLASTSIQPEMDRTHNINPKKTGRGMESQRDGSLSNRHNAEYASVSSLSSSGSAKQTSPTHRMKHSQEPLPTREMSRSSSSSPEKMRSSRPGQREQPRNNSNANHLDLDAVVRRSRPNTRQHDPSKRYSYEIEEKSDATSGEVVFDDIAECGAYLDEKDSKPSPIKIKNRQGKSPSDDVDEFGARRRRNSYELANRSSSEDEENEAEVNQKTNNKDELGLLGSQGGNLLGSGPRGPGMNSSLLSQLAERELANLRNSYKKPQEEPQERPQESQSTASDTSSTSSSTHHESKPPLPKLSPMEYDAVGFRLAGHAGIGESTLNLSATQPQQSHVEADQFSDAEEDGSEPVYQQQRPNTTITPSHSYEQDYSSPMYRKRPLEDYYQKTSPVSPEQYGQQQTDATPTEQVDVDAAMKEIHSTLSKSKLMKAPSFYTPEEIPVWIRQPDAARRYEEDQKKSRVLEDRRRRNEEMRRSHVQQRQEYMKRRDPQCYVRNEEEEDGEDEDKGLMSEPDQKMVAPDYTNRQRPKEPETMRAPDLPPTTGKIREALGRGIIYPAAYLGSTQLVTTKQPTKKVRMQQAQEAVNRIKTRLRKRWYKSPDGEEQPSTEVDLAISNERIRVLNADTQETMMDHPLKTISYIADIGNIVVIMARRRQITRTLDEAMEESGVMLDAEGRRQPRKIICHVFETEDAQLIAQTIGQAFALAYLEFLKANGIEDPHAQEIDYHDVLNSQEIYGDDLMLFSNKECEKEVLVEKERGEIMGMVVVESGWGSLIPTVVIANMSPFGAAARSGKLNIGDQVMSINGTSLVGLPLQQCQQTIKGLKSQCLVKFNVVSCPPVTQVLIKRPDTKYQLGFSVQNGIICSLMRGGIAERGGVRVGHRIIEINGSSVVATAHEKIVEMLSTSVGEIRMKTMPLSMYKLLTGQEQPVYI